jgi:hypothetical protein
MILGGTSFKVGGPVIPLGSFVALDGWVNTVMYVVTGREIVKPVFSDIQQAMDVDGSIVAIGPAAGIDIAVTVHMEGGTVHSGSHLRKLIEFGLWISEVRLGEAFAQLGEAEIAGIVISNVTGDLLRSEFFAAVRAFDQRSDTLAAAVGVPIEGHCSTSIGV